MASMTNSADMTSDRWEGGGLARARARECGVTDPKRVIRVTLRSARSDVPLRRWAAFVRATPHRA